MQDATRSNAPIPKQAAFKPVSQAIILDSITHMKPEHRGGAVYAGSHGGMYAGYYAAKMGVGAVILNDAGIGRELAGVAGVVMLGGLGVPAAAVAHTSARIGDGADGVTRGVLSFVNAPATAFGLTVGMTCRAALDRLAGSPLTPSPAPSALDEARFDLREASKPGVRVIGADSVTLVTPDDAGHIFINGSHGGLLAGRPETAIKVDVFAAVFNDAGGGIDGAGLTRLPALDTRNIAAATVSCLSARIGDGRSTWEHGFISAVNATATRHGGAIGQCCQEFVAAMVTARLAAIRAAQIRLEAAKDGFSR